MKPAFRQDDSLDSAGSTSSYTGNQQGYSEVLTGFEQMTFERSNPTNSVSSVSSFDPAWEGRAGLLMNEESVYQLTKNLRAFSEALTALKAVYLDERNLHDRSLRVLAHEKLGELLQVLKMVVDKYSELNSSEILAMAGVLIKHVKEFNYEDEDDVSPEVFRAINNLAMIFSNSVSECLMGETNISPNISGNQPFDVGASKPMADSDDVTHLTDPSVEGASSPTEITTSYVESADELLFQMESGLDKAFDRAKILSKYLGELVNYVKKKAHLEMEHSKGLLKLAQSTKAVLSEQSFLPFQSLYCTALDHDREYASNCHSMYQSALLQQKFIEPLQAKKNEHDKRRKLIRESWSREKKHCEEIIVNMRKAKATYQSRFIEYQKAKEAAIKAEGELPPQSQALKTSAGGSTLGSVLLSTTTKMDKKKKQEEDTNIKAATAELAYRASVGEANKRIRDLDKSKALYLQQLRDLMLQCDQTAKSVTVSFFQLHHRLFAPLPIQFQAMCEDAKRYEPGFQYSDYIRNLPTQPLKARADFHFEPYGTEGANYLVQTDGKTSYSEDAPPQPPRRHRSGHKGLSDTESSSSRSLDDISPSASPGAPIRPMDPRRHSTEGSLSSEEILEEGGGKEGKYVPNLGPPVDPTPETSPVPTRSFTKNAIKMAVNVREAFSKGKKTKSTLFGVDLATAAQSSVDGIPFLVKRCIAEIDNRALSVKGLYRVNGVKNRVEKLCTQFDVSSERVDLASQLPHDISSVLKYFLRQLPEPLLQFDLYNTFLDISKDYQQLITSTNEAANQAKEEGLPPPPPPSKAVLNSFIDRIRVAVEKLPLENRNTLQCIVSHLVRVAFHSHDNKMSPSNLAIVFGPTLLRPVLTDGNESLTTLIDLPYQSRIVEMLIVHKDVIFGTPSYQAGNIFPYSGFQHFQPAYSNKPEPAEASAAPQGEEQRKDEVSHHDEVLLNFDDDASTEPPNLNNNPQNPNDNNGSYHTNGYLQHCLIDTGTLVPDRFGLIECDAADKSSFNRSLPNDDLTSATDVNTSQADTNYAHEFINTAYDKKALKSSGDAEINDVVSNFGKTVPAEKAATRKRRTSLTQIGRTMSNDLKRHFSREHKTNSLDRGVAPSAAMSTVGRTPPRPQTVHPQIFKVVESEEEEASSC